MADRTMQRKPRFTRFLVAAVLLFALGLLASPTPATASVMVPDELAPEIEQMLVKSESTSASRAASSSSTSKSGERPLSSLPCDQHDDSLEDLLTGLSAATSSTGGSSSGTSSGGTTGSVPSALAGDVVAILDANVVAWTCGESRYFLPTPPGTDLLRPPRTG